jgi:hypothetical protein
MHGMILDDVEGDILKVQVRAAADNELRVLLKTIRDGGRAGLSSGLIRRGSRVSAENRARPQLQVTDHVDLPRTHIHRLGMRVGASYHGRLMFAPVARTAEKYSDGPGRLTLAGREEITLGLHAGEPFTRSP